MGYSYEDIIDFYLLEFGSLFNSICS